jgi:outer membrane protein assembly factor BamB
VHTSDRRIWGSPAATSTTIFIGDLDNRATVALNSTTGESLWEQAISGATAADLTLDGDLLLVGSFDQHLHALDITRNGEERWAFRGRGWFMGPPTVLGGTVYAATMGGGVYAIDRDNGAAVWERVLEGAEFRAAPVVVGGSLVTVDRGGTVYSFSLSNGELQWSQRVVDDGNVNANAMVDGTDLYVVTSKQRLVRVDLARSGAFQVVPLVAAR